MALGLGDSIFTVNGSHQAHRRSIGRKHEFRSYAVGLNELRDSIICVHICCMAEYVRDVDICRERALFGLSGVSKIHCYSINLFVEIICNFQFI